MNSQTQGDACFTNLLQRGSNLDNKFMIESPSLMDQNLNPHAQVSTQESPPQVEMEPTAKKSQRGSNFTIEEDLLLISAWLNVSLDVVQGNEQKHKTYWRRIWEYFHKNKNFISERSPNSLMNRWSTIQLGTNKFCGYLAKVESMHQSGLNEQDKVYVILKMVSMHPCTNSFTILIILYFFKNSRLVRRNSCIRNYIKPHFNLTIVGIC
jgi:hypothetical protein